MKRAKTPPSMSYKRKPHSQLRLPPALYRRVQELARRNSRTAPRQAELVLAAACDAAGVPAEMGNEGS